ncbi:DUF7471 family protein [Haloferacaceae archaeon DSL9]
MAYPPVGIETIAPLMVSIEHTVFVALELCVALLAVGFVGVLYYRRRSTAYLFVALALSTLLFRAVFGLFEVFSYAPVTYFDAAEHGLDVLMIALLFGAVLATRSVEKRARQNRRPKS